jgi:hypothetical protein
MNATQTIRTLKSTPNEISVMIKGNHGIGKSQIVQMVADELDMPCIDFRLSQNDVGDIKGIPFQRRGRTVFAPPEWFPLKEEDAVELKDLLGLDDEVNLSRYGDKGILFLDEINRASREVQQAAFELVLDRRLNLRGLPDGWRVVTAINDNDDLYTVGSLDPAFVSRFFVIDFNPTWEEWMAWARGAGVHEAVTTFLTKYKTLLDPTKEILENSVADGVKKLYDRRSWHRLSTTLQEFEKNDDSILKKDSATLDYLTMIATGFLGSTCAIKFRSFIENDYDALNAEIILNSFNEGVAKKLKTIVKKGRIPELASYNDLLVEHMKNKPSLTALQMKNLAKYVNLMPKEIVTSFWQIFNQELRALSEEWYASDAAIPQMMLKALVNPDAVA